ncbi:hypothetical protein [Actinoplanes sp. NPDC049118]|uniref:hypothetical protein n=1 Tax=Actinoplanes sp. NPDC049118 TaxID=3155769 RepID=UPI0034020DB2
MRRDDDGRLVRITIELLGHAAEGSADADWARAISSELPGIPAGRRARWALGGLWFLLLRRPATWPIRLFATLGILWQGLWLGTSISTLADDAPDLASPYSAWMVATQSAVVLLFLLAYARPWLSVLLAVPVIPAYAAVLWQSAGIEGIPVLAVPLFAGPPALLLVAIAATTVFWPLAVSAMRRR